MKSTIFRHYDIRGVVDSELMLDKVYELGQAVAYYFVTKDPKVKRVLVGMDGRTHSPAIKEELCNALMDSGLDVLFIGVCPAPVLYFGLHTLPVDTGIMITASHNPPEYNGLKICLGTESVWGNEIQQLRQWYEEGKHIVAKKKGVYEEYDLIPEYVATLEKKFEQLKGNDIAIIFDCGNGTVGTVLPLLLKKMEWSHAVLLYEKVDGTYPNHEADPTVEANMEELKKLLRTTNAQLGIGFDGDGDRMAAMTKEGYLVLGDKLLALFAQHMFEHKTVEENKKTGGVVFDIRSSQGVSELLDRWGVSGRRSPAGHASIKEDMDKYNALLGGELSCHFMFKDRYFGFDDGIYAALRLIEIVVTTGKSLEQLLAVFPVKYASAELRLPYGGDRQKILDDVKRFFAAQKDAEVMTIDGIFVQFKEGWGLVRLSHTQPVVSLRFEANSQKVLHKIKQDFFKQLQPYFGDALQEQLQLKELA